jgi:NAD(P)-dependent dehydrogenase (short-subunit alcohol dehydrogenase family)
VIRGEMPQVWLVTGAGRGLGMAIAQAALDAGHQVVATARNTHTLNVAFRHVATKHHQHVLDEIAAWRGLSETTGYDSSSDQPT